jgi:hypothetical protein
MVGDPSGQITRNFERHARTAATGLADRGTFVIDPDGDHPVRRGHRRAASAATPPSCSARSRPPSTSPPTRARSARPSGRRARPPSPRRSTSSARSDAARLGSLSPDPSAAPPDARHLPPPATAPRTRTHDPPPPRSHPSPAPQHATPGAHAMLDASLTAQLKSHLEKLTQPIELVASVDDSPKSAELLSLLDEIASLNDMITRRPHGTDDRRPSFSIDRIGTDVSVSLRRHPLGHEFTSSCSRSSRSAATPPPPPSRPSSRSRPRRGLPLRDLLLAHLPELPRRGAGPQPHERRQPPHPPHRHRRRAVPGRGREPARCWPCPPSSSTARCSTRAA